jgi:ClpX C4-type zinc finger
VITGHDADDLTREAACSFCGKGPSEVGRLIAGPNAAAALTAQWVTGG